MAVFALTEFGMHLAAQTLEPWPLVPFAVERLHDSYPGIAWGDINTSNGVYSWSVLDATVAVSASHGITDLIYTFHYVPPWAGTAASVPSNLNWTNFVTAIVGRYCPAQIKYWEIWNEPNVPSFWGGNTSQMAVLTNLAAPIIRAAGGVVLSPCPQGSSAYQWFDAFFSAGAASAIDVVAFHSYTYEEPETLEEDLTNLRAVLSARAVSSLPLWDTEHSWGDDTWPFGVNDSTKIAYLGRLKLMQHSLGLPRCYWYMYENFTFGSLADRTTDTLLPAGHAYNRFYGWVAGKDVSTHSINSGRYSVSISATASYGLVVWRPSGSENFTVPSGYTRYTTLEGNSASVNAGSVVNLSFMPILFEGDRVMAPPPAPSPTSGAGRNRGVGPQLPIANFGDAPTWQRTAQNWMRSANQGKLVATGRVTLTVGANQTTVRDARAGPVSSISFMPTTEHAAVEKRYLVVTGQTDGQFIIEHRVPSYADVTFTYSIMG